MSPSSSPFTTASVCRNGDRERSSARRPCRISSSSSSTTRRPTARPEILAGIADPRLRVIRNDAQLGLAGSLNRGLDEARGIYVARLDADDVAIPDGSSGSSRTSEARPPSAFVGSAVLEIDDGSRVGRAPPDAGRGRRRPLGGAVQLAVLPPVRARRSGSLERHGLRYDTSFEESEDYELWSRLLDVADGDNLPDPSSSTACTPLRRRSGVASSSASVSCGSRDRESRRSRPSSRPPKSSWRGVSAAPSDRSRRVRSSRRRVSRLLAAFERRDGAGAAHRLPVTSRAWRRMRCGRRGRALTARALRLDPGLPTRALARRRDRRDAAQRAVKPRVGCADSRDGQGAPIRVAAVFPEPTPYRAPLLDRVAASSEIDLTVIYAAGHRRRSDVARRAEAPRRLPARSPASRGTSASCTTTTR